MSGSESDTEILAQARAFCQELIEPDAERWQDAGSVPREFFTRAAAGGLCGLMVPVASGGGGLGAAAYVAVQTLMARHCMASAFALTVHNNLARALAASQNPVLRERYLPAMLRGEQVGAFLLTEPGAGSDAAAITTRATPDGAGWRLSGRKAWITNAATADLLCVYAQTGADGDAAGIASFLVPVATAGVSRLPAHDIAGARALGAGGFEFADVAVGQDAVVAPAGVAFANAMRAINLARATVAGLCCGMLERSLAEALAYTGQRRAFGRTLDALQGVQWLLADSATDLEASRALTRSATDALDAGRDATLACAHAKKFATRVALTRIADCMQVMGAAGLSRAYPLARHLAAAKVAQYLDGATEIQNVVIARGLTASYGADQSSA